MEKFILIQKSRIKVLESFADINKLTHRIDEINKELLFEYEWI